MERVSLSHYKRLAGLALLMAVSGLLKNLEAIPKESLRVELESITEHLKNTKGGLENASTTLGLTRAGIDLFLEPLGLLPHAQLHLSIISAYNLEALPSELIGDIQATSNIEAPQGTQRYELWYQQEFEDIDLNCRVGYSDFNAEFNVMEHAANFPNSSFGIAPQISQTAPPIYPQLSFGARARKGISSHGYLQVGSYARVGTETGPFQGLELGYKSAPSDTSNYAKAALGLWHSGDASGSPGSSVSGFYIQSEATLLGSAHSARDIGVFAQIGTANGSEAFIESSACLGIVCNGILKDKGTDSVGLAYYRANIAARFRDGSQGEPYPRAEEVFDLYYQVHLSETLLLQPSIQYISSPASAPAIPDATQLGLRLIFSL